MIDKKVAAKRESDKLFSRLKNFSDHIVHWAINKENLGFYNKLSAKDWHDFFSNKKIIFSYFFETWFLFMLNLISEEIRCYIFSFNLQIALETIY